MSEEQHRSECEWAWQPYRRYHSYLPSSEEEQPWVDSAYLLTVYRLYIT